MNKPVILCVDDERMILDSLEIELRNVLGRKYVIELAENGEDALEIIEELLEDDIEIPLVISDYIMPQMKGDELLQKIHGISTKTIKVMLTGQANIEAVSNAVNKAKLYRYITKPWNPDDLKLTVTEAIRSYFQEKQLAEQNAKLQQMNQQLEELNHDQAKLIKAYERFVPHQFLGLLDKTSIVDICLGDQVEKEMTILFSDIRGFTSISEELTLGDNFAFLNNYLGQMEPIITAHNGFIDKYIGDAIMALFTNADDAVRAGIAMLKKLSQYNRLLQTANLDKINIGIGINTGPLMLGILGGESRMDGTVIADAVNISARLESLTKIYNCPLLITENTYQKLESVSQYLIRIIDRVTVKGKTQPITIYEIFDADPPALIEFKSNTLSNLEQGFKCFHHEKFEEAQHFFRNVLQINPNDEVAQIYLEQCQKVLNMIVPEKPRILIVDDTPVNIKLLSFFLKDQNFDVLIAEDGETALKLIEWNLPHLILLDIMMPGIDGFETCKKLKANSKTQHIPVIFMTAFSDTMDKIKGFQSGAVDYITKPFDEKEVLSRIQTHLTLHHLQQQIQAKNVELEIHNLQLKEKIKKLTNQRFDI